MIEPDDWAVLVRAALKTTCPACNSAEITAGAYVFGATAVHLEYTCESCQFEFTGLFNLDGYYEDHPAHP